MIRIEDRDGLRLITLARPEKANALNHAMLQALTEAVEGAGLVGARALILSGEGKVFSAGGDLDEVRTGLALDPIWDRLAQALVDFPGLTVAALNGTLAGGAFNIALACDIRLAVPEAQFFYPVARLGYLPRPADPQRLQALVGPGRAKMILLAGQRITAAEALSWGLIERIVAPDGLLAAALSLCDVPRHAEAGHIGAIKAMF